MKNKDKLTKPTSAGRVAGKGLSTEWSSYYGAGGRKEKKTSSESQMCEVEELKAQVAQIPERPRASGTTTRNEAQRHGAYVDSWADDMDCGRPTGASPGS